MTITDLILVTGKIKHVEEPRELPGGPNPIYTSYLFRYRCFILERDQQFPFGTTPLWCERDSTMVFIVKTSFTVFLPNLHWHNYRMPLTRISMFFLRRGRVTIEGLNGDT